MKIILAGQNYHVTGGSDRVLIDEIDLLNSKGHMAIPFAAANENNLKTEWSDFFPNDCADLKKPRLKDVFQYIYSGESRRSVSRLLDNFKPDVFHCHIYYGKLTSSILSEVKDRGIPLVQTLHEYKTVCPVYTLTSNGSLCESCSGFKFYNATLNRCNQDSLVRSAVSTVESYVSLYFGSVSKFDHFISVSDFLRDKVISMGVPENKVTTIHNFTDASDFSPSFVRGEYFVYFGRIERLKGVWELVKSFEKLSDLTLVVVGHGGELSALKEYCATNNLTNINFVGFKAKADLGVIMESAIATIAPSIWYETFGLTLTESFAYGKPVIASNIGGMSEVVEHGQDGLLVQPGCIEELTTAIRYLADNRSVAVEMGRQGRINLERKFNRELHYEKLVGLYENLNTK
jgi:glycosyltransferase involved in cell wall biosynthesis